MFGSKMMSSGGEASLLGEQLVGTLADRDFAVCFHRLAGFVEGHHHDCRPISPGHTGLPEKLLLAFLEADRVDHPLALQALQTRLEHGEV